MHYGLFSQSVGRLVFWLVSSAAAAAALDLGMIIRSVGGSIGDLGSGEASDEFGRSAIRFKTLLMLYGLVSRSVIRLDIQMVFLAVCQ